jgi:hypothetical protein
MGKNFQKNLMHGSNEFAVNGIERDSDRGHATGVTKQQCKLLIKKSSFR